jgi:hypothetical protein
MKKTNASFIEKIIIKRRKKYNSGLGAIFKYLRKKRLYDRWGDVPLLLTICKTLIEQNLPYSKWEVYRAFRLVTKDDYSPTEKKQIIRPMIGGSK